MENMQITEQELETRGRSLVEMASEVTLTGQKEYDLSEDFLIGTKKLKKNIANFFAGMKADAHKSWKGICNRETELLTPVSDADRIVRNKRQVFRDAQERIRQDAQQKAEAVAMREAEQRRKELERRAEKAVKPETKERLEREKTEVYEEPVFIAPTIDPGSVRKEIEIIITDPKAFVETVAKGKAPITCVKILDTKIKQWVKAAALKNGQVPGIQIRETTGDVIRS